MSFILQKLGLSWPSFNPNDERLWSGYVPPTKSGARVDAETAMTISAVHAAVSLLSYSVGMLPLHMFRRRTDLLSKDVARDHPVEEVLARRPNRFQTPMQWRALMEQHRQLRGNGYSEIIPDRQLGFVGELMPLHPDRVRVEPTMRGDDIVYIYSDPANPDPDKRERRIDPALMFHLKGLSSNGITGMSTIAYARESLGLAMITEEYGARTFANSARPSGVLEHPGKDLSREAIDRLRADWERMYGGGTNAGRTVILEEGMSFKPISMTAEDAQFLESRKFSVSEIARWFRVPPHMIGDVERSTSWGSGIEEQGLQFLTYTLLPLLVGWEQEIARSLIIRDDIYFAEFNVDGLLRGDIESRYRAYAIGRNWGWLNVDEIRAKENMNPLPEGQGETYLQPMNMVPADSETPNEMLTNAQSRAAAFAREMVAITGRNGHGHD